MPTIRTRRPSRVRDAIAAGGVVLRDRDGTREVVLTGRYADGTWVFPKGTPDHGEEIEDTALREVEEETGLKVRILRDIGTTDYWFAAPGERVRAENEGPRSSRCLEKPRSEFPLRCDHAWEFRTAHPKACR